MVPWVPILWSYEGLPSITARRLRHTLPSALLMQCEIPFNFHPWWAVAATPVLVGVFFWWPAGDICCPTPVLRRLVRHCQRRRPSFPPRSMSTTPHTGLFQYVHNNWPKTGVRTHQICLRHSWVEFSPGLSGLAALAQGHMYPIISGSLCPVDVGVPSSIHAFLQLTLPQYSRFLYMRVIARSCLSQSVRDHEETPVESTLIDPHHVGRHGALYCGLAVSRISTLRHLFHFKGASSQLTVGFQRDQGLLFQVPSPTHKSNTQTRTQARLHTHRGGAEATCRERLPTPTRSETLELCPQTGYPWQRWRHLMQARQ